MKAIVAEIDKKQMLVITNKGDFIKVKRQMSATIGSEVEVSIHKTYMTYKRLASVAACFLACIFLSTGVYAYYTPYSYVSVDINPSIALSLNRFERVISVDPLTEDAVGFIKDTRNLKNQEIDKALSEIIKSASEKGYIDEETENQVMVVVSAKNPKLEERLANTVNTAAVKGLSKVNKNSEVIVEKTSLESYKTAVSNKVSPGREILADRLREYNPEIKDEVVQDMSVKEVVKLIKEGKKAAKAVEKDNKATEREQEEAEYLQSRKYKNKKGDNEAAKADPEDEGNKNGSGKNQPSAAGTDSKFKPGTANKDTKVKNGSNDEGNTSETGKNQKGNRSVDNDNNEDNDEEEDKADSDKDESHKGNWDIKDKSKLQGPNDLETDN